MVSSYLEHQNDSKLLALCKRSIPVQNTDIRSLDWTEIQILKMKVALRRTLLYLKEFQKNGQKGNFRVKHSACKKIKKLALKYARI